DHDVDPPRRLEAELDPEDQHHDDGAKAQDHEHGWAIAGVVAAQVEPTYRAALDDAEHAAEQTAAAAARASPAQGDINRRLAGPVRHRKLSASFPPPSCGGGGPQGRRGKARTDHVQPCGLPPPPPLGAPPPYTGEAKVSVQGDGR